MSQKKARPFKIAAPVNAPEDVEKLVRAGANELYCGLLPQTWTDIYGASDLLNKRQGTIANLTDFTQLEQIQKKAKGLHVPVALTLNTAYTQEMLPKVLEIAGVWADLGGDSVMVSDLGLMLALQKRHPGLKRHLSILANAFNSKTIQFFTRFAISRVVLPRQLHLPEIKDLIYQFPDLEFEVMSFNDKCPFIDGLCHFYHSTAYSSGVRTAFSYSRIDDRPVVTTNDPAYSGHGCSILQEKQSPQRLDGLSSISGNPGCAACFLEGLSSAGVDFLKLGGRGLPVSLNARNITFINQVVQMVSAGKPDPEDIKNHYRITFNQACHPEMCYYPGPGTVKQ